jgi:hypothetical protein
MLRRDSSFTSHPINNFAFLLAAQDFFEIPRRSGIFSARFSRRFAMDLRDAQFIHSDSDMNGTGEGFCSARLGCRRLSNDARNRFYRFCCFVHS